MTIDEILEQVAINTANQYGGFMGWELPSEKEEALGDSKQRLYELLKGKAVTYILRKPEHSEIQAIPLSEIDKLFGVEK